MNVTVGEKIETLVTLPKTNGKREIFYPESDGKPMAETDVHITLIADLLKILRNFFGQTNDVKVLADIMFYYEEGNLQKSVAPDLMVVRGVGKHSRRTFKLWEEKTPDVIFEISSRGTWKEDLQKKYFLYQELGVKEYYIFDPEYDYLENGLIAYHLKDSEFQEVEVIKNGIFSPALNLEIVDTGETLRLFNPETRSFLPTMEELEDKTKDLESENEKLKAELAKLKRQK
ncbi:MAG TPA: Uma2 family endonuclease [Pyrinomonadaceae bacterium]|nr:Uma2 family endonuclease [Pyrinomonadaceae bacterium]